MSQFPYRILIPGNSEQAHTWCYANVGYRDWFISHVSTQSLTYAFRNESEAMLFRLTWGGEVVPVLH